jgi:hypothetical protein
VWRGRPNLRVGLDPECVGLSTEYVLSIFWLASGGGLDVVETRFRDDGRLLVGDPLADFGDVLF